MIKCSKCGHEYDMSLDSCPECGTSTAQNMLNSMGYDTSKQSTLEESDATAPSRKKEKVSTGIFGRVFKEIDWYYYAGLVVALILLIIAIVNTGEYHLYYEADDAIAGCYWISIGYFVFFLGHCILAVYNDLRDFVPAVPDGKKPGSLGTTNNIGTTFLGCFRYTQDTFATYEFLCFFLPLFPIGCYRVKVGATTSIHKGSSTSYTIYGSEKSRLWEVVNIYLTRYGCLAMIIGAICLLTAMF